MLQHFRRKITFYLGLSMRNWWLCPRAQNVDQKSSLVLQKVMNHAKGEKEGNHFEKDPYLEPEKIVGKECSQLLVKPCKSNTLQEDKEGVRMNILTVPSISLTDLFPASKF